MLHRRPCAYNLTPSRRYGESYMLDLAAARYAPTTRRLFTLKVMTLLGELRRLNYTNELDGQEITRHEKRPEANDLDPFKRAVPATP
jgi:hypothetical protein